MPAADVTVSATFKQVDYAITFADAISGSVRATVGETQNATAAHYGDTVTLNVVPDGQAIFEDTLSVTYTDVTDATHTVKTTPLTGEDEGKYTFTMPAYPVTVTATIGAAVDYIGTDGRVYTTGAISLTGSQTAAELPGGWYYVPAGQTVSYDAGIIFDGSANLILADDCHLTVGNPSGSAISTTSGLHIYGQTGQTGRLTANGGGDTGISGDCEINGGTVTATGNEAGFSGNSLTVNGGAASASGAEKGIWADTLTVNGGAVTASDASTPAPSPCPIPT